MYCALTNHCGQGLGPIGQCAIRWALIKGASRVIAIDRVPARLKFAETAGADTIDFSQYSDIPKRIREIIPEGLDVAIDCGSFHEPKTIMHKVQKTLMLETDVPETINEAILSVKKLGRVGVIAAYAGFTNGFNIGALMEKGVRLIGNGQGIVFFTLEDSQLMGFFSSRTSVLGRDFERLYHPWKIRPNLHDHSPSAHRRHG